MEFLMVSMFFWALYLILTGVGWKKSSTENNSLVLVHVLFRHGNRTANGPEELYPKDPYLNKTYFPFGLGQLTNAGKRIEFAIGKALRNRYDRFLGPYYTPEIVESFSTDYNRTKMSLQLVLASLFPPRGETIWNPGLYWQSIPYNYIPYSQDKVLLGMVCPYYLKLYDKQTRSTKQQAEFHKDKHIFDYISNNTGLNVTTYLDVYNLYFGLATEEEWGFELPPWTKEVWPETIINLSIKEYFVATATTDLSRMAVGYFLQKIISDTNTTISGGNKGRKLYLYSAHENNIAELLLVLGVFEPLHIPTYGSYVTLEVHKMDDAYGIKIYYENYDAGEPQLLKLPGCESLCEINKFVSLIEEYIPREDMCGNKKKC